MYARSGSLTPSYSRLRYDFTLKEFVETFRVLEWRVCAVATEITEGRYEQSIQGSIICLNEEENEGASRESKDLR